jgi:DNA polymerase III alpha subunit (gram-positive type)
MKYLGQYLDAQNIHDKGTTMQLDLQKLMPPNTKLPGMGQDVYEDLVRAAIYKTFPMTADLITKVTCMNIGQKTSIQLKTVLVNIEIAPISWDSIIACSLSLE